MTKEIKLNLHDARQVARAVTVVENREQGLDDLMDQIYPETGKAHIVGVTGAPGAGKSSLVNTLIKTWREQGYTIGVIAVDPSSPFSGGAILGDRVRMQDHSLDTGVFIRSMASRGSLGGVSVATREAVAILDAAGFDIILIETVGVGQSEVDIVKMADTNMVILTPQAGDSIQTMKAGIMEIGDLFVINKSDIQGADKIYQAIEAMLDFYYTESKYKPQVISTTAINDQGIKDLTKAIDDHKNFLVSSGKWSELRANRAETQVLELVKYELFKQVDNNLRKTEEQHKIDLVKRRELSPNRAAKEIISKLLS